MSDTASPCAASRGDAATDGEAARQSDAGELRIGSSIVVDAGFLPAVIERFVADFPKAVLHVVPENIATQQLRTECRAHPGPATGDDNEPDLIAEQLFDKPNMVAAGAESRCAKKRNLSLGDLMEEPWVLAQPGSLARSLQDEVFRNSGFEPPPATMLTVSLHLYMRLIETGRWLGLVPASAMRFGGMQLKALLVKLVTPPAPLGFITVKDCTLTPLAERFIACARKVAGTDGIRA
jgi:DNA-binding transcriptional LysR family regulator